jgi:hypothetical protein
MQVATLRKTDFTILVPARPPLRTDIPCAHSRAFTLCIIDRHTEHLPKFSAPDAYSAPKFSYPFRPTGVKNIQIDQTAPTNGSQSYAMSFSNDTTYHLIVANLPHIEDPSPHHNRFIDHTFYSTKKLTFRKSHDEEANSSMNSKKPIPIQDIYPHQTKSYTPTALIIHHKFILQVPLCRKPISLIPCFRTRKIIHLSFNTIPPKKRNLRYDPTDSLPLLACAKN